MTSRGRKPTVRKARAGGPKRTTQAMTASRSKLTALLAATLLAGLVATGAAYLFMPTPRPAAPEPGASHSPTLGPGWPLRRPGARPRPAGRSPCATRTGSSSSSRHVTHQTGITFVHTDGSSGRKYIMETMSGGLATFDYDGDGLIDVYFPNGAPLPGATADRPPRHALWRNLGDWRFQDVTEAAGVAATAFGMGLAVADYDNDGYPDIYLSNFGPNVLYHNNGDGTFTDVTRTGGRGPRTAGRRRRLLPGHRGGRLPGPVRRQLRPVLLRPAIGHTGSTGSSSIPARWTMRRKPMSCSATWATARSAT